MNTITITAFKQNYYCSRALLNKSTLLSKVAFERDSITLRLPHELKPAFEWILERLVSVNKPAFPSEHFPSILHLSKHMGIQIVIYDIYNAIINGQIDVTMLIQYYPMYYRIKSLRAAAVQQIITH